MMDMLQQQELEEKTVSEVVDFKMVTFSLAGKEYGIDIMKVKEISKADRFTYVPNTAPYVRGVYNLRGDIISIIDLRVMFHLPAPSRDENTMEDMIILRLDSSYIGIIVDSIDKVVGISSRSIQPPHPLFGDINIKFIKGIVENDNRLYIILDVEKILGENSDDQQSLVEVMGIPVARDYGRAREEGREEQEAPDLGIEFLKETLKTFRRFTVGDLNSSWVSSRYREWKSSHGGSDESAQLNSPEEADQFLESFYSPHSGDLWQEQYSAAVAGLLPEGRKGNLTAWNPGCGKGCETYSFTALLRKRNPEAHIKVWANDNDLLAISTAPNLVLHESEVPAHLKEFTRDGASGSQFTSELRDRILFEYHDVLHPNPFPEVDCILARDILSFMSPGDRGRLLAEFGEKLKPDGLLIPGSNEVVSDPNWEPVEHAGVVAYRNKNR